MLSENETLVNRIGVALRERNPGKWDCFQRTEYWETGLLSEKETLGNGIALRELRHQTTEDESEQ